MTDAARTTLIGTVGLWEGTGRGGFPTIASFTYRERLEISATADDATLHYLQQTWRHEDGGEVDSHVETGFITVGDGGVVHVMNAQGSSRVEVLEGAAVEENGVLTIDLESVALTGDERMISSWRKLVYAGDRLRYEMGMSTTAVTDGELHLSAELTRG
jgi:hypothetical protein